MEREIIKNPAYEYFINENFSVMKKVGEQYLDFYTSEENPGQDMEFIGEDVKRCKNFALGVEEYKSRDECTKNKTRLKHLDFSETVKLMTLANFVPSKMRS